MPQTISPKDLRTLRWQDQEFALIDLREEGVFARGHLFLATPLALSQLELQIRRLVPRFATRIILMDDGEGLAARAAAILSDGGYRDIAILDGTLADCRAAGFQIFEGVNVPSKAFGEFVELACRTPHIAPQALKRAMDEGEDLIVLDSRPFDEYWAMNIPGAISCPSEELVYRFRQLVPRSSTTVVVNCAGRTRSIIGAQTLLNAQVPNRVVALENGAMGWRLAGYQLEEHQDRRAPTAELDRSTEYDQATRMAKRAGVAVIDHATFADWRAEQDEKTLYVFDVRSLAEYREGHLPDAIPVEGVQLVQKTDNAIAVRNARILVTDDDGIRARITASWLAQMGLPHVTVLADPKVPGTVAGPYEPRLLRQPSWPDAIELGELAERLARKNVTVVDLSRSLAFKTRHIPGAWFAIRARLSHSLANVSDNGDLVLTSNDGVLAQFAAPEAQAASDSRRVLVLAGGNKAWFAAGLAAESGLTNMADPPEDAFWRPYELDSQQESEMERYLSWEQGVVELVKQDGFDAFRPLTPAKIWEAKPRG